MKLAFSAAAPRLFAGIGTLTLLAGLGLLASRPAHTAGGPIAVTVTNPLVGVTDADSARQAVSSQITLSGPVFSAPSGTLYTVPADKHLVLESMSVAGNLSDTNKYSIFVTTTQGGVETQTFFDLVPDGSRFPGMIQPMRLYPDPGTKVDIGVQTAGTKTPFVAISFSGHLVNL